ncbi:MAG TPA: insulinase family protein [Ignavibacteria bacterium]|nr:insulinase family protein [Ignavibacteria bacterium]
MDLLNINYEKYSLKNGLKVILHQKKDIPLVAVNIWYKVGSSNEVKGKTGIAHLFEHMMFQGSLNVPKEKHFKYIQEAGGTLNASTSFDRTNYYEKLPSNYLELALWLESDRMGFFLPALDQVKLDNQKGVVSNERLQRYDNQPYGLAWETIITKFFPDNHPYSWPTIGFMDDIKSYTLDDVQNFFTQYYSPSNATLTIVGNIDLKETKYLVEKYFAEISANNKIVPIQSSAFSLEKKITLSQKEDVQLERIYLALPSVEIFNENEVSIDILLDILAGSKSSRLHKKLVHNLQIAQDVSAFQFSGKYGGVILFSVTAKPGLTTQNIKQEILNEIDNVNNNGITENELLRAKNVIKSQFVYSLQNIDILADQINHYDYYLNEPNSLAMDLKRYADTSIESVVNASKNFLTKNYLELVISPKK